MKKRIKWIVKRMLLNNVPFRMATASSLGLLIGMLPLIGIRMPLLVVLSFGFGLNIIALLIGMAITIIFPVFYYLSFFIGQHLGNLHIYFFNLRFLKFSDLLSWTKLSKYYFIGSLLSGTVMALIFFPIFKWFYSWRNEFVHDGKSKNFIFYDHTGVRRSNLKKFLLIFSILLAMVVSVFGVSISVNPFLPELGLKSISKISHISDLPITLNRKSDEYTLRKADEANATFQLDFKKHRNPEKGQKQKSKNVFAFYVDWDENSLVSLTNHIKNINYVVPNWYVLRKDLSVKNNCNSSVDSLIRGNHVNNMPLINNYVGDKWDGDLVHRLIASDAKSNEFIAYIVKDLKMHHYSGINMDFESLNADDKDLYVGFISKLSSALKASQLKLSIDVPAEDEAFDYDKLTDLADYMIVMMYDEHYEEGEAGPIASEQWFEETLDKLNIPEDKLVVSVGSYGYDWNLDGKGFADDITYGDILQLINDNNLKIKWDQNSGNPYVSYKDDNERHMVWLLDAATMYNELKYAIGDGICGAALWRLGSEDPTIWPLLKDISNVDKNLTKIETLTSAEPVNYTGAGEILKITSTGRLGKRSVELDSSKDKDIINEVYVSYPLPYTVERFGKAKNKEVVLTFDDGPNPEYTPPILNILKKYNIKAAFFIVGENGEANPDLVERIYREGHEIGNHTFTHPNVANTTVSRTKMELNTTQRLIQELTGHSTILFRPPYVADAEPSTPEELSPIYRAQKEGYMMIGELIDPEDWQKPSVKVIVQRVMDQLSMGNVILLHDAGGNREQTVKALPIIIEKLKQKGYQFTTLHDLMGLPKEAIMPSVDSAENPLMNYDRALFDMMFDWEFFVKLLFYTAIVLGILRFAFLVFFAGRQHKNRRVMKEDETFKPFVSVVIAAFNEEKVIAKTVRSILEGDYDKLEIIVVNDGSSDNTAKVVEDAFEDDTRVIVISQKNGGKSSAVNTGFKAAHGEFVVCLDADTIIAENAISLMIRHFVDQNVAAVSGNVKVGNVHNLLTKWQQVEYVTGFNLERRAFAYLNCITVVPGAIGAWRKSAVEEVGYYHEDTLAEDTDITLKLLRRGYTINYEEFAYAYTESPSNLKSLLKQRYRWAYGTLQCLWKHREALFSTEHKTLGFIALPNMWLFQYVFQSLSPLADIYFVIGLMGKSPLKILVFYLVFLIVDYLAAFYAFMLEGENPKPLLWLFLQRLVYRQFMTLVVVKSIFSAFTGITVGWNKLQRMGNVDSKEKQ